MTKLILPEHIYHTMLTYAKLAPGEISGFAKTRVKKINNDIHVYVVECKIFTQTVSGVETTLTQEAMTAFYMQLVQMDEDPSLWNLWWHSHVDMAVFWSGTDEAAIKQLRGKNLYSIVVNRKHHMLGRQDGTLYGDHVLPVVPELEVSRGIIAECEANIAQYVTCRNLSSTKKGNAFETFDRDRLYPPARFNPAW